MWTIHSCLHLSRLIKLSHIYHFVLFQDRLIVSEVSASSCKLSWQASRNTGGLPLDYLVERLAVADGTWVKAAATTSTHITINDLGICCQ